jgi:hypothetical protein
MQSMNLLQTFRHRLPWVGAATCALGIATAAAQPTRERTPDVSNKALITTQTPAVQKPGAKGARVPKQYSIEQFMATTKVGGASFSHDEKEILFHSNKSGIFNVYSIPIGGGEAKQLTSSTKESTYLATALRNDSAFLTPTTKAATRTRISTCASSTGQSAISRPARRRRRIS